MCSISMVGTTAAGVKFGPDPTDRELCLITLYFTCIAWKLEEWMGMDIHDGFFSLFFYFYIFGNSWTMSWFI